MAAKDLLEQWVGTLVDPWNDFRSIDDDNSGTISFDEFCDWSIKKNLDLDGGDSPDDSSCDHNFAQQDPKEAEAEM